MDHISVLLLDNNERFLNSAEDFLQEQDFIENVYATPSEKEAFQIARNKKTKRDSIRRAYAWPKWNRLDPKSS